MGFQFFRRKLGILKYEPEKLIKNKMTMSKLSMKCSSQEGLWYHSLPAIYSTTNNKIHTQARTVVQMLFE